MRRVLTIALASAAFAAATPASATLHGFCNSTAGPCVDNGSNTPTTANPPNFGFWSSPGGETGTLLIDILVPNNLAQPPTFTLAGPFLVGTFNATLFSSTAWTSGQLDDYLGVGVAGATPANPIGAYIQPNAGQTGWWVYQANLGSRTLPGAPGDAFTMLLGGGGGSLATGSYIVGYLTPCPGTRTTDCDATANSAAIREVGSVPEPATWAMMLVGFGGIGMAMRRRRKDGRLLQVA
jgi:PEP-CTERM motif